MDKPPELTILMPCLDEAETIRICIEKANSFLKTNNVSGEVLIADNGSTDGSQEIALSCGARVVSVTKRGYGAALIGGCEAALGKYVIMGDADDSYDFSALMPFLENLRAGDELVMGNRFKGQIMKGAMPPLHKYLGNPVLSFIGRLFYPSPIGDFHCGLRGYNTEAMRSLGLRTLGMEYASEMVVQATLNGLKISEVPITLHKDGRSRPPHLRSWRDGWRHLKFLLMHAPNWLFLLPGSLLASIGLAATTILAIFAPVTIGNVSFALNTMVYMIVMLIAGVNILCFGVIVKVYAQQSHFIPNKGSAAANTVSKNSQDPEGRGLGRLTANSGSLAGVIIILIGIAIAVGSLVSWGARHDFGEMDAYETMRRTLPSLAMIVMGIQLIFTSFVVDILRIKVRQVHDDITVVYEGKSDGA
ncbi:MAG: glycosyltransferase family 2 protein [Oscillospiraceae bacterium]|nr:glycosyltransferase family 2 protein [Oscillospiraceae bacterium]MCL2279071.1 glycosyltransferase family 2 protein [Oscillospiraceae bacterium]